MKFDHMVRRAFPSLSKLTYNPLFKVFIDLFDIPGKILFRELRGIPRNHMRIRVGVENRLFFNEIRYYTYARFFWMYAMQAGWCRLDSTILDIGCGCGRYAHDLRDFYFWGRRFSGKYYGVDIDKEMLNWCRNNFDSERFSFIESTDKSISYNRPHATDAPFRIPIGDGKIDFIFSGSLFSHLLESELNSYLRESYRLLKPGGYAGHTCICLDYPGPTYGDRHTFSHKIGNASVESLKQPEAAVAYTQAYLFESARQAEFKNYELVTSLTLPHYGQQLLLLRKTAVEESGVVAAGAGSPVDAAR